MCRFAKQSSTASILKGDSKGLDKFYYTEEDEEQMTTRATKKGLLKNLPQ
jgi:hypothetical protein